MQFHGVPNAYSESGIDLTQLRRNLRLTLEDRWCANLHGLSLCRELQRARRGPFHRDSIMADFDAPRILQELQGQQVEFVLIGGLAMIAHGSAYVTNDLDICYARSATNVDAVARALTPLHPYLRGVPPGLPFVLDAPTIQAGLNFTLVTDAGDLDLFGHVPGVGDHAQALAQSEACTIFGMTVQILTLDGLIAAKTAAGRPKDKLHLLELDELKKLRDVQP